MDESGGKLVLLASKTLPGWDNLYKLVDFLNKTLKDRRLMFGLTLDSETGEMTVTVYET